MALFASHPLVARFLAFVALPLFLIVGSVTIYIRSGLPSSQIEVVSADGHRVDIRRDVHGVAFITAARDADVFFAMGYAHAQDRMWEMELLRRTAQGRLSEIFGMSAAGEDAWMRTLGMYEAAKTSWPALSVDARASLSQYSAGVNAWLKTTPVLPPEFLLLDVKPLAWSEVDSLSVQKIFALSLAQNYRREIFGYIGSQYYDSSQQCDLLRICARTNSSVPVASEADRAKWFDASLPARRLATGKLPIDFAHVGSNAWVISGALMKEGAPLLANDTHMQLQMPSPWYVVHLRGDSLHASGMTLAGLPVVIFGRNADIAWGGTNMEADVQDLYFEQVDPQNPARYATEIGWQAFGSRAEEIIVRANFPAKLRPQPDPIKLRVRSSHHGPIISEALGIADQSVALKWTALQPGDASYESFFRVNYARDWKSFREAFRNYVAPALTILYADTKGHIGSLAVGRIPIRAKGTGTLPVAGWTGEYRWSGYIPFEDLPIQMDPEDGYLVSANDRNVGEEYPYFISDDWALPYRATRIRQLIEQARIKRGQLSLEDAMETQGDTLDLSALKLAELLSKVSGRGTRQQEVIKLLSAWRRGDMSRTSQGAAVFFVWVRHLREELFTQHVNPTLGEAKNRRFLEAIAANASYDQVWSALTTGAALWCDQPQNGSGACLRELQDALDGAINELTKLRGSNTAQWSWGEIQTAVYPHAPFSKTSVLAEMFERRIQSGGSPNTINAAGSAYVRLLGYEQSLGASFRQIMQMKAESPQHWYMNSTGQSGNPLSTHYDDMLEPFRDVRFYSLQDSTRPSSQIATTPTPK